MSTVLDLAAAIGPGLNAASSVARPVAERIRPTEQGYDFEIAFLLAALAEGLRVRSVRVPTIYQGQPSHFRRWGDTWRQTRVFTRYGRQIIFGLR